LQISYQPGLLDGVNVIKGKIPGADNEPANFTAIPFYSIGNRSQVSPYKSGCLKNNDAIFNYSNVNIKW